MTSNPSLFVQKLSGNGKLPTRHSSFAPGYDLYSAANIEIPAHGKMVIPTDISIAIPKGYYGRIGPCSGLAFKHFINVGPCVIDTDYHGPIGVVLFNSSHFRYYIWKGERIAQLILEKIFIPKVVEVNNVYTINCLYGCNGSTTYR